MPEFRGKNVTNSRVLEKKSPAKWRSLTLYRTQVNDDGIIKLCELGKQLEEVHIVSDHISDASMPALCGLTQLKSLLLDGVPRVTDSGIASIANLKQLRELYLNGTQLTDAGIDALLKLQNVWSLSLAGTQLTDAGVSKLGTLPKLSIVRLDNVQIDGWGLQGLPNTIRMYLYLDGCPISDRGLIEFLLTHDRLEILSLNATRIGDGAMPAIAALPGLADLRLTGTAVTDDGARRLIAHPSLSKLYLEETSVTDEVVLELKAESPQQLIVYH